MSSCKVKVFFLFPLFLFFFFFSFFFPSFTSGVTPPNPQCWDKPKDDYPIGRSPESHALYVQIVRFYLAFYLPLVMRNVYHCSELASVFETVVVKSQASVGADQANGFCLACDVEVHQL